MGVLGMVYWVWCFCFVFVLSVCALLGLFFFSFLFSLSVCFFLCVFFAAKGMCAKRRMKGEKEMMMKKRDQE